MSTLTSRHQRTRTLALTAGMVLGMAASVLAPQLAHARVTTASKQTLLKTTRLSSSWLNLIQ